MAVTATPSRSVALRLSGRSVEQPIIRLRQVIKNYKTPAGDFPALKGINADILAGEFIGVFGKSGAGKTTLVNVISAVDHLTSGEIWVGDTAVHKLSENQASLWRGRNLGVIFQSFQLMPTLSVLNNILLPLDFTGGYRPRRSRQWAMDLLEAVELSEHAGKLPSEVSGGQQQRVAIARALVNDPAIILADEPTGRLDSTTAETIFEIFERLVHQGKTIIMVSHEKTFIRRFSRLLWLADGELTEDAQF
jgi:putative ABC transport system ATP-binding protein